jgi:hypothetical protein
MSEVIARRGARRNVAARAKRSTARRGSRLRVSGAAVPAFVWREGLGNANSHRGPESILVGVKSANAVAVR